MPSSIDNIILVEHPRYALSAMLFHLIIDQVLDPKLGT